MFRKLKPVGLLLLLGFFAAPGATIASSNISVTMSQQNGSVSGVVLSENEPVIGATVIVQGTSKGSITDIDGKYSLTGLSTGDVLEVSFLGYTTQTVTYNGQSTLNVELVASAQQIDDVVVVGYGTMRKSDVTGSIAVAKGDEMIKAQSFSAIDNLRGKAAGVNIFSNSGQPGGGSRVIIRGISTINASSDPLYIVDGVAMEDFKYLNPNDIESIEVLKDASSAAIYGARGANGVILVTTKRGGKQDGVRVSYSGSVSVSTAASEMDVMTSDEWVDAFMIGLENENKYVFNTDGSHKYNWNLDKSYWFDDERFFDSEGNPIYDTNWQDEATRTAISHNHQLSIQQAAGKSSIGAFLNYTDQQGIMLNTYEKRVNAKMTYDAKPKDWLSTGVNMSVNHTWGRSTSEDGGGQDARRTMIEMLPWLPVQVDGDYTTSAVPQFSNWQPGFEGMSNPVMLLEGQTKMNYRTQVFGNASLTFHLAEGLDLKTQLGIDMHNREYKEYSGTELANISAPGGRAIFNNTSTVYWQEETYLTYNKNWGKHRLNAMAGLSWQARQYNYNGIQTEGFSDDFFQWYNMGAGTNPSSPSSSYNDWAMNSYFLRAAYSFDNKYMATVTTRVDGSSKFGPNSKYAFFPSLGLGWNISEEQFLKDASKIDLLKLHASYGITGNSEIGTYQSLSRVTSGTLLQGDNRVPYTYISTMANPDLEWEKTSQLDAGVNLIMFGNRLNIDVSAYYKLTSDLLLSRPVPHSSGFSSVYDNIGEVSNRGVDVMISTKNITTEDFSWNTTLNFNYNKNRIEALGTNDEDIEPGPWWVSGSQTILRVGESLGAFYGYDREGIWQEHEAAEAAAAGSYVGRPKRSAEKQILGKGTPDFTGSFINEFRYKQFDFTLDMQFVLGVDIMEQYNHSVYDRFGITNGLSSILYDAYDPVNNPNTMQQAIFLTNSGHAGQNTELDSEWIADGSYLRANLIQIGYTLPQSLCEKWGLSYLRAYVGVNNAFVIDSSGFSGYDPEGSSQGSNQWGQNMFFFQYPKPRTVTLGASLTF